MRSAFGKEVLRSIRHSLGRFVAIAAIVALGCGFYAGLRMTAPDMKLAADEFFDGTSLMDIRVVSTLGLTDDDLVALRDVEGVQSVMGAYETDVVAVVGSEQHVARVHSLPQAAAASDTSDGVHAYSDDAEYLNRPILVEGSWPQNSGECVLSADLVVSDSMHIGDVLTITDGTQDVDAVLATRTYTIVGYVSSPYYATSSNLGSTTLGSGAIQEYLYVPESDFSADLPYTEAFLTVEGAADEKSASDAYEDLVAAVADRIEGIAPEREQLRVDGLRADAQAELDEARAEYESEKASAEQQLADAQTELAAAAATIASSEQQLASAQASYDAGVAELAGQRASAEQQMSETEAALDAAAAELESQRPQLDAAAAQLAAQWAAAGTTYEQAKALEAQLAGDRGALAQVQAELAALSPDDPDYQQNYLKLTARIDQLQVQIAYEEQAVAALAPLVETQDTYNTGKAAYDSGMAQVAAGREQLAAGRASAAAQMDAAQQQLDAAAAQLASGRTALAEGRAEYASGLAEYEAARAEADAQLADAAAELNDAQRQIDDLEHPDWLVMDRTANYGSTSFNADADRVDSIAQVFPFIFFLVAALVALTTMTRMVEEERVLIGTFKALGYRRGRIASKYLVYAGIASVSGSLLGVLVLSQVLPAVIMRAYGIIYFVPNMPFPLVIDPGIAGLSIGLGVGVTLFATWAAATATLRERPATLMLPRAPKAGKRILLERVAPLWRHLSFSWKVTCRNLFRYKKRFVMTVIGIAGCTALLLTGLGLSDAINDIIDKQFGDITRYNAVITLDTEAGEEADQRAQAVLDDGRYTSAHALALKDNILAEDPEGKNLHVQLLVPLDAEGFGSFFDLRTREGNEPVALADDGLVLSEKLARQLGVDVGDTVELAEQDAIGNPSGTTYAAEVTGVVENYIYHYAFMGPDLYEQLTGEAPAYNTELAIATTDSDLRAELGSALGQTGGVKTVAYNDETVDAYRDMLSSVNMIVVVLVVAAAALAFIVLYNLTNINITERQREIATLKVLGFTPREVDAYIYRETMLLSIIGALVGLALGVFMESFVVVTAEVDQVMFGRVIHPSSFLLAFALTMVFTVLVMLAMRRKLKRVNMVESLKSVE